MRELGSHPATIVSARGVTKAYGRAQVLKGVDLRVARGQVYGFLGRNGAGKSTMIRILAGITRPTSGVIELFGHGLPTAAAVRRRIGYVAQDQNFYGWMTPRALGRFVRGFYPTWDDAEYTRLCRQLDLPDKRRLQTFSGGMKVKVALALSLAHRPELLILDEPTAGLDPVARREFIAMVRNQAEQAGRTTFFSSHWVDEVEAAADTMGILEDGAMRYQGSLSEFARRVRRFRRRAQAACEALPFASASGLPEPPTRPDLERVLAQSPGVERLQARSSKGVDELVLWFEPEAQASEVLHALDQLGFAETPMSLEDGFVELVTRPDISR